MPDNRRAIRAAMERPGWINIAERRPLECVIRDLSDDGARLVCPRPDQIPNEFGLAFTVNGKVGRQCMVIWRSAAELGVEFITRSVVPESCSAMVDS